LIDDGKRRRRFSSRGVRVTSKEMTTIGPWTIESKLGEGGNAIVYRATRDGGRTHVALKVIDERRLRSREAYKRLQAEIAVLREHSSEEGVLPLLDFWLPDQPSSGDPAWLAMPIAEPLLSHLGRESSLRTIVEAGRAFASTLARLHACGISHRDIKPQNLYFLDGWRVGDFGLVDYPGKEPITKDTRWLGPLHFMAPEMLASPASAEGPPADVYALAKTMWVLAASQRWPPPGELRVDVQALTIGGYRAEHGVAQLDRVIEHATRHDPTGRPSMDEFEKELSAWIDPAMASKQSGDVDALARRLRAAVEPGHRQEKRKLDAHNEGAILHEALCATFGGSSAWDKIWTAGASCAITSERSPALLDLQETGGAEVVLEKGLHIRIVAPISAGPESRFKVLKLDSGFGLRVHADGTALLQFGHVVSPGSFSRVVFTEHCAFIVGGPGADAAALRMETYLEESFESAFDYFTSCVELGLYPLDELDVRLDSLSADASILARFLGRHLESDSGQQLGFPWEELEASVPLQGQRLHDALQELHRRVGLVLQPAASSPYGVYLVGVSVGLAAFLDHPGLLSFSLSQDVRRLCAALAYMLAGPRPDGRCSVS
jgi:serine/threonine protein kinase